MRNVLVAATAASLLCAVPALSFAGEKAKPATAEKPAAATKSAKAPHTSQTDNETAVSSEQAASAIGRAATTAASGDTGSDAVAPASDQSTVESAAADTTSAAKK